MSGAFRAVSWNVLADCYARGQGSYIPDVLRWNSRKALIEQIIVEMKFDVICLQEVDHFDDFFSPLFTQLGCKSVFAKRPTKRDGCLIGFREERFQLQDRLDLDLDCLSYLDSQRMCGRSKYIKNNIAVILLLFDIVTNKQLIVSNCHIHWNPSLADVKLAQVCYILQQLAEFQKKHGERIPLLLAGDFNSFPHSQVYKVITSPIPERNEFINNLSSIKTDGGIFYGPNTKFLCDASLLKLCRWLRILGVQAAIDNWDKPLTEASQSSANSLFNNSKNGGVVYFFNRAITERRVLLTTSKSMLERNTCPRHSRFINPSKQLEALALLFGEYGLELSRDKFLTVCGKCGGEIERLRDLNNPRLAGKYIPSDREVFACIECVHPYWWNDDENR
jgi:uncharacterized protein with PIN domain/exonuclease III